mgnify:CR=1 FL=1
MSDDRIKVLFIAGAGRSGSTLLHNVLGQLDGYVAVGEIREIWRRGILGNWRCGCDTPFHGCEFWNEVIGAAYGGAAGLDATRLAALTEQLRVKDLPATLIPSLRNRILLQLDDLLRALEKLFVAIHDVTGSSVIVDSSKNPSFGYLLHAIPRLDVFDLHLVRHPAAVAFSWQRRKDFESGRKMPRQRPAKSAAQWMGRNVGVERFIRPGSRHFAGLRYEDFIAEPVRWLDAITQWLGESAPAHAVLDGNAVELTEPGHSVFGNQTRFHSGTVQLRRDDRWIAQMEARDVREVALITWPLLAKYRYALRPPIARSNPRLAAHWWTETNVPNRRARPA